METDRVTIFECKTSLKKYAGVYVALESTSYSTYITRLSLTSEIIDDGASIIVGNRGGEIFNQAKLSIRGAFMHPLVLVLDSKNDKALFMTLTHSPKVSSQEFSGFTRFVNEVDANLELKTQYMSETFLSVDLNTFVQALNGAKLSFKDGKKPDELKNGLKTPEIARRLEELTEYSVATEALFKKVPEINLNPIIQLKMTRFDNASGDFLTTDYKAAKILNNLSPVDWKDYRRAFKKLKK